MKNPKFVSTILIGTCLITLASCGGSGGSSNSSTTRQEQQLDDQGIYRAVLRPLNTAVAGETTGTVEIRITGDDVVVESNVVGAPAGVKHLQNITTSNACPITDTNGDTFIDIAEALPATGQILIPLDSDLSEQLDGMDFGPIANSSGSYVYKRSTTLSLMLADLRAFDPDPLDPVVKIAPEQDLNLSGRVLIVHGVDRSSNLPDSVATVGSVSREQALPIACGQLVRINSEDAVAAETEAPSAEETETEPGTFM